MLEHLREIEDVHIHFVPLLIESFLNVKAPEQACDRDEGPLFRQSLSTTDPPSPAKRHVPLLTGKGARVRTPFNPAIGVETVWVRKFSLMVMDGPNIPLDPSISRDQPTLDPSYQQIDLSN